MIDRTANGPYMMKRYVYVYHVTLFLQLWRFVEFFFLFSYQNLFVLYSILFKTLFKINLNNVYISTSIM